MGRMGRLLTVAAVSGLLVAWLAVDVAAQRGRRGRRQAPRENAAISAAMGDLRWGMSKAELLAEFTKRVRAEYRPKLQKAPGAIEEDRLRHKMNEDIRRIHESYVEFKGRTTGWDVSFLRDEFTHRNGEAMIVVRDDQAQNFYFLINNRFWKWYRAFNQEVFAGADFTQFATALQGRYGQATEKEGVLHEGAAQKHWLEWEDRTTRLRAVDETTFYGFYCLVFEDKNTLGNLASLRRHKRRTGDRGHALVDSVTSGEESASGDDNADIVDRITGNIRRTQQAPEE